MKTQQLIERLSALHYGALRLEARAKLADELADLYFNLFGPRESQYWTRRAYYRRLGAARIRKSAATIALQINQQIIHEGKDKEGEKIQPSANLNQH